jgi:hypothetical protein
MLLCTASRPSAVSLRRDQQTGAVPAALQGAIRDAEPRQRIDIEGNAGAVVVSPTANIAYPHAPTSSAVRASDADPGAFANRAL